MSESDLPLVSVVIPSIRNDPWLAEAIMSARGDGYPHLEIILVWDGKPGEAPSIPGVLTVTTGGRGTAAANNLGLRTARGEFIARLDADDISMPGRFEAQVRLLQSHPDAALAVANAIVVNEESVPLRSYPEIVPEDLPKKLLHANALVHSTFMFRGARFEYNERCVRMQDYELALRIARESEIVVSASPLVGYRVHDHQSGRQTSAFWTYIPIVLRARRHLASTLGGFESFRQWRRDAVWFAAQYANHIGLRDRYGSLRSAGPGEP